MNENERLRELQKLAAISQVMLAKHSLLSLAALAGGDVDWAHVAMQKEFIEISEKLWPKSAFYKETPP